MGTAQTGTLWRIVSTRMPTKWGMFDAIGFERDVSNGTRRVETALAFVMGDLTEGAPLLRIHSQCFTATPLLIFIDHRSAAFVGNGPHGHLELVAAVATQRTKHLADLRDLGIRRVRLLSNNPRKASALFDAGVEVVARIPCEAPPNPHSFAYLRAKKEKLGHTLALLTECPA